MTEEERLTVPAGDPDVSLSRLTGTVNRAAHHRNGYRSVRPDGGKPLLDLGGDLYKIDLRPPAGGTGNDPHSPPRQSERRNKRLPLAHLVHWIGSERHPYSIADAVAEQTPDPDCRTQNPRLVCTRLGNPEMKRIIALPGKDTHRLYHRPHIRRLDRKHRVVKIIFFKQSRMKQRTFRKRLRGGRAVFFKYLPLKRPAVHAYPYRYPGIPAGGNNSLHPLLPADVSGIYPDLVRPRRRALNCKTVIEMNIRNYRNGDPRLLQPRNVPRRLSVRHRHSDYIASYVPKLSHLRKQSRKIRT